MTLDERLEFLRQSTESLHASCQELHAIVATLDARERRGRQAILAGIIAYLKALDGDDQGKTGE